MKTNPVQDRPESRDWRLRGFDGPHYLEQAATPAGASLAEIETVLLHRLGSGWSGKVPGELGDLGRPAAWVQA